MSTDSIEINLEITPGDMRILSEELNNCNSIYLQQLVEKILMEVNIQAKELEKLLKEIRETNPFKGEKIEYL